MFIQSRFRGKGNFEVVVPLASKGMGCYWRDIDDEELCCTIPDVRR
jgi:hypothetical protein